MRPEGMVAGVTVIVTVDVAPAESDTVRVTAVSASTFFGVMLNDAPTMVAGTGITSALLDLTENGPFPPVIPMTFGVLPNALNVAGVAESAVGVVLLDEDDDPPPPQAARISAASALTPAAKKREVI